MCFSFITFRHAIHRVLGNLTSSLFVLITCSQFHFLFYASRPLPNTFALIPTLLAFRCWLLGQQGGFIWSSAAAIILFRAELAGLLGIMLFVEILRGRYRVWLIMKHAVLAGIVWLGEQKICVCVCVCVCVCTSIICIAVITVLVDSVFWGRWLWPEGEVLWFNTVLNKSHLWGVSIVYTSSKSNSTKICLCVSQIKPMWWYFVSALPRCLLLPMFFFPWALYTDKRSHVLFICPLIYVSFYSLLPHKELRFIIYTIPLFNLVAALALSNM